VDCLTFLDRLAGLLEGSSTPSERAAADEHATSCPECGELLRASRGESAGHSSRERGAGFLADGSHGAADMVRSVLARTTGAGCGPAERQLCDFVDGALDPAAASLLAAHLDHCPSCSALAESLRGMTAVLASLAELEPDPRLLPAVLNATSRRPRRSRLATLISDWSQVLLARPRFSLEAAYAGTLLFVLVFGNPAAILQAASARTMTVAEAGMGRLRTAVPATLSSLPIEKTQVSGAVRKLETFRESLSAPRQTVERATGGWLRWFAGDWTVTWRSALSAFDWLVNELDRRTSWVRQALKSVFPSRTEPQAAPGR
jgi:predicted anti-sigma-YlaC factor YlaD